LWYPIGYPSLPFTLPAGPVRIPAMETKLVGNLSEPALALFRLHVERKGQITVDDSTREPYRELAKAGLMMAGSTFRDGEESIYRLTREGFDLKNAISPSHAESA
jgi:hypothetical protein